MKTTTHKLATISMATLTFSLIFLMAPNAQAEEGGSVSVMASVRATSTRPMPVKIKTEAREGVRQAVQNVRAEIKDIRQNASSTRAEIKDEIKNIRVTAKEQVREKLSELKQSRIRREVEMVVRRFNAAVERLQKLAERIKSRIGKLETAGINMDSPKTKLTDALVKIQVAQADVDAIANVNPTVTTTSASSTNPGLGNFAALRQAVEKAKESIKVAHSALVDVVVSIKPGAEKLERETHATTTKNSNESSD